MDKTQTQRENWLDVLSEEDSAFLKRFLLASGSLKQLAKEYDVSYPTVRARLDRLIEKVQSYEQEHTKSEFERILLATYAEGNLSRETMKVLIRAYQNETAAE
ncbi:hypothetical protein KS4_04520 [Poriferisphaera corsica]|uniref:DUF2089 domain-containing protein n=1 Tax=Poriferisphaera corsica TaxID=2528020 RepID=A0A517YQD2_9BACT|nr:DUF2089 family protein [Poriferisphaera corsica]QDU32420.1 hypothetical protein KS4_04520 [Poriferisphaera corsica]